MKKGSIVTSMQSIARICMQEYRPLLWAALFLTIPAFISQVFLDSVMIGVFFQFIIQIGLMQRSLEFFSKNSDLRVHQLLPIGTSVLGKALKYGALWLVIFLGLMIFASSFPLHQDSSLIIEFLLEWVSFISIVVVMYTALDHVKLSFIEVLSLSWRMLVKHAKALCIMTIVGLGAIFGIFMTIQLFVGRLFPLEQYTSASQMKWLEWLLVNGLTCLQLALKTFIAAGIYQAVLKNSKK